MAQTLKFGNGTWATKKGSTLAFNDEDGNYKPLPFTTTRSTSATRVNKEGLIEVVENDRPRIDYTDSAKGALLLEPQRTNLITYSEDFSQWFQIGTATITSNYGVSPDGTQNSSRLQMNASDKIYFTVASSGDISFTVYLKGVGQIRLRDNTSTGLKDVTLTSEWVRYELNFNATISNFQIEQQTGVSDFEIYGAQVEQGSYASSYIPTQGASATRLADTASGSGNSEVFNDSEGVLFANISALTNIGTDRRIAISDGSISNRVFFYYAPNTDQISAIIVSGGVTQVNIPIIGVQDKNNKFAIKYKVNDVSFWVNGFEIDTDIVATMPSNLSELAFDDGSGANDFYGKTKELAYYNTILTDLELETLTSYSSLSELVTELNLNTL